MSFSSKGDALLTAKVAVEVIIVGGSYVLILTLNETRAIEIGAMGEIEFEAGAYAYVGSAMNGLDARIERHLSREKRLHWHIDHLLEHARVLDVVRIESDQSFECAIAQALAQRLEAVGDFGCSDCGCNAHLFYAGRLGALLKGVADAVEEAVPADLRDPGATRKPDEEAAKRPDRRRIMRREDLVTHERQLHSLGDVIEGYAQLGIRVEEEHKRVPAHRLIATQNAIELEKYTVVLELVREGLLDVPVLVEEHFTPAGEYERYLIDGHTRTRARIELGHRTVDAFVIYSPAGDWNSNFVKVAAHYGNTLVKNLPIEPRGGKRPSNSQE